MTATYNDTYCQGVIINGTTGNVEITKMNSKSFKFEGTVDLLRTDRKVQVQGVAKFWKNSKDGKSSFYKCGSAVLTLAK